MRNPFKLGRQDEVVKQEHPEQDLMMDGTPLSADEMESRTYCSLCTSMTLCEYHWEMYYKLKGQEYNG